MNPPAADSPAGDGLRSSEVVGDDLVMVLNNSLASIEEGRLRMARYLGSDLTPRVVNRLEVVFEELISNVLRHGFDPGPGRSILVAVGRRPGEIQLTVEDDGRPFNPFDLAEPPPFESLETAQVGGLGVPVVRRFSTRTAYDRAPASNLWDAYVSHGARPANRVTVAIAA
jgi:anti-sigma regulatory factor (Ser/Thr protein kinase)